MKPAPFSFVRPQGLQHALEALAADPGAKVLAGGQSLVPLLNMRLAAPSTLVDINGLPDLDAVQVTDDGVRVGALARHADVLASPDVRRVQPLVSLALAHVAHATIRNRGTVVGSLVHADAAAELPMVLTLLGRVGDGAVDGGVATHRGRRPVRRPPRVHRATRRDRPAGVLPRPGAGEGVAFDEIARRHGDYALCGAGAVVRVDGEAVVSARVGYLSVCDVPTVVDLTEAWGSPDAAADLALARLDPADDIHATAAYRARLVRVLTARVLQEAYDDARRRSSAGGRAESRP